MGPSERKPGIMRSGRTPVAPGFALLLLFYNLALPILFLISLPALVTRLVRRGRVREKFWERFGIYSPEVRTRLARRDDWIWVHAVSVGEMLVARRFIARLREMHPDAGVVLSTTTSTGLAQARARSDDAVETIYYPLDFPFAVRAALRRVRPRAVVFVEAAPWPNLAAGAWRAGARLAIVDARVSPRSRRRYARFRQIVRPLFSTLELVCVSEADDAAFWTSMGVRADRVVRTGSIKHESSAPDPERVAAIRARLDVRLEGRTCRMLLGGSTWPGEEETLARIYRRRRGPRGDLVLVVVPRHVERAAAVLDALRAQGLTVQLWKGDAAAAADGRALDVLVVDVTGELRFWYALADVVFVGKSLCSVGGQNPVEAAVAGCPLLFGPHMENFRAIADRLVAVGAAIQVRSESELDARIGALLDDPTARAAFSGRAASVLAEHRGAVRRCVVELFDRLDARGGDESGLTFFAPNPPLPGNDRAQ